MTWTFLLGAAGLLAACLALLLPPFLRRADAGRRSATGALVLGAFLVAGSVGLYMWIGTPEGLTPAGPDASPATMEQAVASLERRLRDESDNLEGWMLLGRSRMAMGDTSAAVSAYRRARELAPGQPDVLVALAEAIAQQSGHRLAGEPQRLLKEALRRDPSHQRALWFSGIAAWQAGAYEEAASHWETLLEHLEADSDVAASVREQLSAARAHASADNTGNPMDSDRSPPNDANVTVTIRVAEELEGQYDSRDLVFVFARPAAGSGMPLAVKRIRAGRLPATITLGPDDSMTPANALTPGVEIVVGARISSSGSATPAAGDLEGQAEPRVVGDGQNLTVIIDRRIGQP